MVGESYLLVALWSDNMCIYKFYVTRWHERMTGISEYSPFLVLAGTCVIVWSSYHDT
jgi:hypothetical protein